MATSGPAGSPLLWPDSSYNTSVRQINQRFQGTDHLYVIVEGKEEQTAKLPVVLRTMEAFQRAMERSPHVGGTDSLVGLTRQINAVLHHNDPRWAVLPRSEEEVGGILMPHAMTVTFVRSRSVWSGRSVTTSAVMSRETLTWLSASFSFSWV